MDPTFIRSTHSSQLAPLAMKWIEEGSLVAMVTLVNIEGNAPYPVGTQMLVKDDGEYRGQITGGCAEKAIADQAVLAIKSNQNCLQRYGLNSPFFDIQLPCGSGIDVFIDVSTSLNDFQSIDRCLAARQSYSQTLQFNEISFEKRYLPNPRLVLVGQGEVLIQTSLMALASGFDVMCIAQNQDTLSLAADHDFEMALLTSTLDMRSIIDEYTGLVSLFHEHEYELDILSKVLTTNAFYIGALGSRRTHAKRLSSLRTTGVSEPDLLRIHGPVGLNIGANTPPQIAVSIVAESIEKLNDRLGQHSKMEQAEVE